jgi:hypothetical protein
MDRDAKELGIKIKTDEMLKCSTKAKALLTPYKKKGAGGQRLPVDLQNVPNLCAWLNVFIFFNV